MIYKLIINSKTNIVDCISRTDDNEKKWVIPFDPANTDYQAYLKWLEDPNNKPLPADE